MNLVEDLLQLQPIDLMQYKAAFPILEQLEQTPQSPKWHPEGNVLIHTNLVMQEALKLQHNFQNPHRAVNIYVASLLHDFGKPFTTTTTTTGKITAYDHERVGVSYARDFLRKYFPFNFPRREHILDLVENHRTPLLHDLPNLSTLQKLSLSVDVEELFYLSLADSLGRAVPDRDLASMQSQAFKQHAMIHGLFESYYTVPGIPKDNYLSYNLMRWDILMHKREQPTQASTERIKRLLALKPCTLLLPVGAPGSGKSSYFQKFYPHIKQISMDNYRKQLTGDVRNQTRNAEVFALASQELVKSLKNRESVVWDATNVTRKVRKTILDLARNQGASVLMVYFDLPLEEILRRNESDDRLQQGKNVPTDIVTSFYRKLQNPKPYEYDKLLVVDEKTGT